ncbi:hypothetical protein [Aquibacillus albus]|uniref:Uncharacterized protein (UPF0254 family) n=1 Tax=Aquibacillus albus TaxID=1168171 RepID=A0ABS2MVY7_9BACI|nr:hypothetical protein [Aquibacillus albus]MBM7570016.1 uncharacterized protein (UPF0254 family) [Aquibacillus albus]
MARNNDLKQSANDKQAQLTNVDEDLGKRQRADVRRNLEKNQKK